MRFIIGHVVSLETRARLSAAHMGPLNHSWGKIQSPEHRAKHSAAEMGKTRSPETRAKMSAAQKGKIYSLGSLHPNWKGGEEASCKRSEAKRRNLGYVYLNAPFPGCDGHHVDQEQVIHIPHALHHSISHCLHTGRNMAQINAVAYNFLFKQEVNAALEAKGEIR